MNQQGTVSVVGNRYRVVVPGHGAIWVAPPAGQRACAKHALAAARFAARQCAGVKIGRKNPVAVEAYHGKGTPVFVKPVRPVGARNPLTRAEEIEILAEADRRELQLGKPQQAVGLRDAAWGFSSGAFAKARHRATGSPWLKNPGSFTVWRLASRFGPAAPVASAPTQAEGQRKLAEAREQAIAAGYGREVKFKLVPEGKKIPSGRSRGFDETSHYRASNPTPKFCRECWERPATGSVEGLCHTCSNDVERSLYGQDLELDEGERLEREKLLRWETMNPPRKPRKQNMHWCQRVMVEGRELCAGGTECGRSKTQADVDAAAKALHGPGYKRGDVMPWKGPMPGTAGSPIRLEVLPRNVYGGTDPVRHPKSWQKGGVGDPTLLPQFGLPSAGGDCRRCKGACKVKLGKNLIPCPMCQRKGKKNPLTKADERAILAGWQPAKDRAAALARGGDREGAAFVNGRAEGLKDAIRSAPKASAKRRNPLDSHKPGCQCMFHSGRMGKKRA